MRVPHEGDHPARRPTTSRRQDRGRGVVGGGVGVRQDVDDAEVVDEGHRRPFRPAEAAASRREAARERVVGEGRAGRAGSGLVE